MRGIGGIGGVRHRAVVVGAGPAGLAAAAELARVGLPSPVLERGEGVGSTWRRAYDRLRLNTSRFTSRLSGVPYPRGTPLFPTRDDFVRYLERYAHSAALDIRAGVHAQRLAREAGVWRLETSAGELAADDVIVATGFAREPALPPWALGGGYRGTLVHAADYRNAGPCRDRDVLVVGCGSSGMEIAHDLACGGAARVRLAVRTPPTVLLRSVGGVPGDPVGVALFRAPVRVADAQMRLGTRLMTGDLSTYGLPAPREGPFERLRRTGAGPAVVDREVVDAIKARRIEVVAGVSDLDAGGAVLDDGRRVDADAIVLATGYRCGLESLCGSLGVLDDRGVPRVVGGREAADGLRFVGFVPAPGQIRRVGLEGKRVAREIARRRR